MRAKFWSQQVRLILYCSKKWLIWVQNVHNREISCSDTPIIGSIMGNQFIGLIFCNIVIGNYQPINISQLVLQILMSLKWQFCQINVEFW